MDNAPVQWLHLSDFHTGKDDYAQERVFNEILKEVKDTSEAGRTPDFIFISGDIANKGKRKEYETFEQKFIVPLLSYLGADYTSRIFIVPGNHDVDRDLAKAVRRYDVLEDVPRFLDPTEEGKQERDSTPKI